MTKRFVTRLHSEWIQHASSPPLSASSTSATSSIVFLHGLLGNGRNVKTLARNLCGQQQASGLLLDLRGHGKSALPTTGAANEIQTTFADCTRDVQTTIQKQFEELSKKSSESGDVGSTGNMTLVGHSLGGRLSLQYAFDRLDPMPSTVWLLDTVPGEINQEVRDIVKKLHDFVDKASERPAEQSSNKAVAETLHAEYAIDQATSQWLASAYKDDRFEFDLSVVSDLMQDFKNQDFLAQLESVLQTDCKVRLVRAGRNDGWEAAENSKAVSDLYNLQIKYANFEIHLLPDAGHWVHVDDLAGLLQIMES